MFTPSRATETVLRGPLLSRPPSQHLGRPEAGHDRADRGADRALRSDCVQGPQREADVSAQTRKLVQNVLVSSGYRRRASGEAPPLIDIVFNDFDSPWATEIVRGAAAAAQAEGLTVASRPFQRGTSVGSGSTTSRQGTRGIILLLSQLSAPEGRTRRPRTSLRGYRPNRRAGPGGELGRRTNWSGGLAATKHLVDLGTADRDNYRSPGCCPVERASTVTVVLWRGQVFRWTPSW